jgi:mono/diheme cytochrome c family protein
MPTFAPIRRDPGTRTARLLAGLVAAAALLLAGLATAATDPIFDFIPDGGRTLLARALAAKAPPDEARAIVTGKRARDDWLKYLRERRQALPALQKYDDRQMETLADYLAFNMPLAAAKIPGNPTLAAWEKALPPDGRDFTLDYCQGCHIVTVVVTQDRTRDAWFGSLGKPSHVQIKLNRQQREALVAYLVLNAAIPIDQVPRDLRAGGATY